MGDVFIDFDMKELDNMLDMWQNWSSKKDPPKEEEKKKPEKPKSECECGCDKVYGPKNTVHSDWCKKYKKEK